ncbi:HD-GYP domain-containing protein [Shewanella maritima]|uniref:HD-GYP domain-containing protein n=1 Tax=Shewanella maritima TaxID=2520507 RepID=A0A411PDK4_9GAMM|nr:HD-GYP domain-containing protein [Shewanella maritima]QBF81578.1 HD-GYP domain-containing protein [Shewanella maritima]
MSQSEKVSVQLLQVGMFIRLPASWKDHPFLFNSFKIKDTAQIQLIKRLGIKEVFYVREKSDAKPAQANGDEQIDRQALSDLKSEMDKQKNELIEKQQQLKRRFKKTEQKFDRSLSMMRSMTSKISSRPLNAVNEAKELINNLTDILVSGEDLALHLMADAKPGDVIYHHALNVSMLSMLMAKELDWPREKIELIGLGALFHDIGKFKIPSNILRKKASLTDAEQNLLKQHPLMSINFLKLADSFPDEAKPMIANHHEFLDGSGYPQGLKQEALDEPSQLLTVVNEFDALCNGTHHIKAKTPSTALGQLYKNYKTKLNTEYVGKFIKKLGVYPPGSVVELSNGQFALVITVNLQQILLPDVIAYDPLVPKEQAPIISLQDHGLKVVRSLPPSGLPEKVMKYLNPRTNVTYAFGK